MCVAWAFVANFLGCHVLVAVLTIMAERTVFLFLRHRLNFLVVALVLHYLSSLYNVGFNYLVCVIQKKKSPHR